MIENVDGTITITSEEVFAAARLNEHLLGLGVRVKALRADPDCDSTVAYGDWGDLYPRIVLQDHRAPGVTIRPDAIPLDHTLVLSAERTPRPGPQPPIVVRTILVSGSAPDCVGGQEARCSLLTSQRIGWSALGQLRQHSCAATMVVPGIS